MEKYKHALSGNIVTKPNWNAIKEEIRRDAVEEEELIIQDENGEEHANPKYEVE